MKIWCIRVGKKWSPCKAADWVTTSFKIRNHGPTTWNGWIHRLWKSEPLQFLRNRPVQPCLKGWQLASFSQLASFIGFVWKLAIPKSNMGKGISPSDLGPKNERIYGIRKSMKKQCGICPQYSLFQTQQPVIHGTHEPAHCLWCIESY